MKRTLYNCSMIKKMVAKGLESPKSENDDEPCETCKKCKLNYMYGEGE